MTDAAKLATARAYLASRNLAPKVGIGTRWTGLERTYASLREAGQALNLRRLRDGK